jgi:hypothetical protein
VVLSGQAVLHKESLNEVFKIEQTHVLVVEPDYLSDSEVLFQSRLDRIT